MKDILRNKVPGGKILECSQQGNNQGTPIQFVEITADNLAHVLELLKNQKLIPAVYNHHTCTLSQLWTMIFNIFLFHLYPYLFIHIFLYSSLLESRNKTTSKQSNNNEKIKTDKWELEKKDEGRMGINQKNHKFSD